MDPQGDTAARLAGTPAKATRNGADSDAIGAAAAHVSTPSADKAMLLSSPAAFSFPRKHPPALSSKPRKATSLFRHPASEAGKKGNDCKTDASSSPVTHEDGASQSGLGDSSFSAGSAAAGHHTTAYLEEEDGEARTHGEAPTLWSGGSGVGGGSGSGVAECFGSPARPPRENTTNFRFTPQRNLIGLFASPVPPPPPTPPPAPAPLSVGDDLPLGLGSEDRKTGLLGGPTTDDVSMLRFSRRMQQASESEPPAGGAAPCPLGAQPPSPPPPTPQSRLMSLCQSPSRPQARPEKDTAAARISLPPGRGDDMKDKPAPASPEELDLELEVEEAVAEKQGEGGQGRSSVAASEICVSNEALRSSDEAMCTLEILVKHTRERVGVTALECWRVAELKRRLVYLKLFAVPEAIALVPRHGGPSLENDVLLGALDVDATYEARTVTVSAAAAAVAASGPQ